MSMPPTPPPAPPVDPPKSDPPPTPPPADPKPKSNFENELDKLESGLIAKLGTTVAVEEYSDMDQKTRIKIFRDMAKLLPGDPKTPEPKPIEKTGTPANPALPIPKGKPAEIKTLAQLNNYDEFVADIHKKSSLLNTTAKLRGKT